MLALLLQEDEKKIHVQCCQETTKQEKLLECCVTVLLQTENEQ